MLRKFKIRNYKNFKEEICIDFKDTAGYQFSADCLVNGTISKMLIYGRNATGKTNLGKAILDIRYTMFSGSHDISDGLFLNADSTNDAACFSYEFEFDKGVLLYQYERLSNKEMKTEKLVVDGKTIFVCDFEKKEFRFENLNYISAETANVDIYKRSMDLVESEEIQEPKLPFLRWLISNVALNNDSLLIRLSNYVRRMRYISSGNSMPLFWMKRGIDSFNESLEKSEGLEDLEDFLNAMGIECKLILRKLPDGQRELYFSHKKLVPFYETASSGTLALVDLYKRFILSNLDASFLYLDEYDAFYHYEMAENVINYFKKRFANSQIIMTSHNTNLMTNRLMRPDCLFILSREGTLTALCNATQRELREGHNLEKMYISGEFSRYE